MGLAVLAVVLSFLFVVGLPIRWMFRPFAWMLRWTVGRGQLVRSQR
jgi:hypothetical protein